MSTLPDPESIKRIDVATNAKCVSAIQRVMTNENVDLTEAVRRLLMYGDYVYSAIKIQKITVQLVDGDSIRDVELLQ
jgi:hypothetical protein